MGTETQTSKSEELIATIDPRELHGIRWGMMRQMFPKFVEEVELDPLSPRTTHQWPLRRGARRTTS